MCSSVLQDYFSARRREIFGYKIYTKICLWILGRDLISRCLKTCFEESQKCCKKYLRFGILRRGAASKPLIFSINLLSCCKTHCVIIRCYRRFAGCSSKYSCFIFLLCSFIIWTIYFFYSVVNKSNKTNSKNIHSIHVNIFIAE